MKKILYLVLMVLVISCQKKESSESLNNGTEEQTSVVENEVQDKILYDGESVYGNFFVNAPIIGYSAQKENALASVELSTLVPEFNKDDLKNAGLSFSIIVNGVDLTQKDAKLKSAIVSDNSTTLNAWFGQDVTFIIKKPSLLKNGEIQDTVQMYVPQLVNILSPKIETQEELYPYCYYENFELHWTADECNENGVVVMVEWLGSVIGKEDVGEFVRNLDVIPEDDGIAILNNDLFASIPDKAIVYLTVLRGNISVENIDEMEYKVIGETHEVLPMILIKNLE